MKTLRLHTEQLQPQEPKSSGGTLYGNDFEGF